ncbi:MAG TPA: helix-turn-helix transcriptional regulator [Longimicrobiales bacterium]|nr:helix-turn-helix transcriptional regulator [Longimicrobiales bacterium]
MGGRSGVGEFEQLVLLVVLRLGDGAFAPEGAAVLEESAGRSVTRGALYSTLNRLDQKGLLTWAPEEPGEDRGGHIRRLFSLTDAGLRTVRERRATMLNLWSGLESVLDGEGR